MDHLQTPAAAAGTRVRPRRGRILPIAGTTPSLARRSAAEALGTALLLTTVVGSGIMAERLSGGNAADVTAEIRVGGRIDFQFGSVFHPVMEIVKLAPGRTVDWKCVGGEKDWLENRFIFSLTEEKGMTQVQFVQDYATELSDDVYGRFNFNWGYYLQSLKELCETGKGFPFSAN